MACNASTVLSVDGTPWLADHAVLGTVLLPGTALLDFALYAGGWYGARQDCNDFAAGFAGRTGGCRAVGAGFQGAQPC